MKLGAVGTALRLSRGFSGQNPLRKRSGSKEHLDWLKIDLNGVKIISAKDYKCSQN